MESRFIAAALSGTATERKTSISSRNDTAMTAPMNSGRLVAQLGVEVVGDRGDPGDVDVAGDDVADPVDGRRGVGVGGAGGRGGGEDDGVAVRGDLGYADRGDPGHRGERAGQAVDAGRVDPGLAEVGDHHEGRVDADPEALGEQVVGLAVGGVRGSVAGGREAGLDRERRDGDQRPGWRPHPAGRARAGRRRGGRSATRRCPRPPSRGGGGGRSGPCRSGRPAARAGPGAG